jgi:hypothetical protein
LVHEGVTRNYLAVHREAGAGPHDHYITQLEFVGLDLVRAALTPDDGVPG